MAARLITFLAVIPALLVVFVRHRRGDGRERTQLRWLLWAASVCLIAVALSLVVPSSLVANIALFGAVLATSGSVVVGISGPIWSTSTRWWPRRWSTPGSPPPSWPWTSRAGGRQPAAR